MDDYSCPSHLDALGHLANGSLYESHPWNLANARCGGRGVESIAQSLVVGISLLPGPHLWSPSAFPARSSFWPPRPVPHPLSAFCKHLLSTYYVPGPISGKDLPPTLPQLFRE